MPTPESIRDTAIMSLAASIRNARTIMAGFIGDLEEDPVRGMIWSNRAFTASAVISEYPSRLLELTEGNATVDQVLAGVKLDLLRSARSAESSSCTGANILDREKLAALARLMETLIRFSASESK